MKLEASSQTLQQIIKSNHTNYLHKGKNRGHTINQCTFKILNKQYEELYDNECSIYKNGLISWKAKLLKKIRLCTYTFMHLYIYTFNIY